MVDRGIHRADSQGELLPDRIEAAVDKGIAPQEAQRGKEEPAKDPEAPNRLYRIGRAGRFVLAASWQGG